MDLKTQLVTVRCSATLSDVPGIFDINEYYGGIGPTEYGRDGNTGYLNKITITPIDKTVAALTLGFVLFNPYVYSGKSINPLTSSTFIPINSPIITTADQESILSFYAQYVYLINVYDFAVYGATYNRAFAARFAFLSYQEVLDFYSYIKNTLGRTPGAETPYFASGPVSLLTGADALFSLQYNKDVVKSSGNPYQLTLDNYLLTEIYQNYIIPLFGNIN
jgi:hypothetical protein